MGLRITINLGGSVFAPEKPKAEVIQKMAGAVRELRSQKHEVLLVVGGGGPARDYIREARKVNVSRTDLDKIGIDVTRLHARMLITALGAVAEPDPPTTVEVAARAAMTNKVPVMGGTTPGQTTDAVAAALAKVSGSEILIIFSDVGAVFTRDPKLDPKARKIERMTPKMLVDMVGREKLEPGMQTIIDPVAARVIERYKIRTIVLGESEINRLPLILAGAEHSGTVIEG
ncbi:MAG: UMP kinase [Candidatus Hadarchaeota archaeon]